MTPPPPRFLLIVAFLLLQACCWSAAAWSFNSNNTNSNRDPSTTPKEQPVCTTDQECADVSNGASVASTTSGKDKEGTTSTTTTTAAVGGPVCSLYMAPSSLLGDTGWGLYTGVDLAKNDRGFAPHRDVLVPILDHYKTLPFRGQQKFAGWLHYIWPKTVDAFRKTQNTADPVLPISQFPHDGLSGATGLSFKHTQTGRPASMFVPGIGSLANSHDTWTNIRQYQQHTNKDGDDDMGDSDSDSDDSDDQQQSYQFQTTRDIAAGSELFLHYGDHWHERLMMRQESRPTFETLADLNQKMNFTTLPTEADKRAMLDPTTMRRRRVLLHDSIAGGKIRTPTSVFATLPLGATELENYTDPLVVLLPPHDNNATGSEERRTTTTLKSVEWLQQNGHCVDQLRPGTSTTEDDDDDDDLTGAFVTRFVGKGQVVAPAPLIMLKRDDLNMYQINPNATADRNKLDLTVVVGVEPLLSYCYGHVDSDLLILPYSPMVHWIQHASSDDSDDDDDSDALQPNVEIVWSTDARTNANLQLHPIDVLDLSGKLRVDFVALRDIQEGEEILVDAGDDWYQAVEPQERAVPEGFFPDHWLNKKAASPLQYEIKDFDKPLAPGELRPLQWKHNGKQVAKYAYRLGLPKNFSQSMYNYSQDLGILDLYQDLLNSNTLASDEWMVMDTAKDGQWFAHRFMSSSWNFNMHYVAAWSEQARLSLLGALGTAGFDTALESMGQHFGLNNLTCFHMSYMGVTEADSSMTHTDVYATGELGFNIIFPVLVVPGSKPELDVQSEDNNVVVSVKYMYDTAIVMGDWGYHKTSAVKYDEDGQMRVVVGGYCASIGEANKNMIGHLYDGEDPAPFMDQYLHETHWSKNGGHSLPVRGTR